jgi:LPXTG-motif cell wall-anchored protein
MQMGESEIVILVMGFAVVMVGGIWWVRRK